VPFRIQNGCSDLTDTEPGLSPLSAHLLYPQNRKLRAADCGLCFTSGNGARLGGLDTRVAPNSKSLANLLCTHAQWCLRTHGPVLEARGSNPGARFRPF